MQRKVFIASMKKAKCDLKSSKKVVKERFSNDKIDTTDYRNFSEKMSGITTRRTDVLIISGFG